MINYKPAAPVLLSKKEVARMLNKSISGLDKYVALRPEFPKIVKDGVHRQSPVFYVEEEILGWINRIIKLRGVSK